MARFFIDRPIFAWVIAIVIMVAGALSIGRLPISRYPTIAPPTVAVNAVYPGASAQVIEDSVTQIIEQSMTGLDGLIYISSTSESNGRATVTLTFASGTNSDIAQVQVQNKLQQALPLLPQIVQQQGVNVTKTGKASSWWWVSSRKTVPWARTTSTTTSWPTCRNRCRGWRAWAGCGCSVPSTPCASGSTPASWKPMIRHLPVLKGGHLVGIITDRDLNLVETLKDVDPEKVAVEDAMTPDPYTVSPEVALDEVVAEMAEKKYGSAVVIDNNKVVGVFTTVDAMSAFAELLHSRLKG